MYAASAFMPLHLNELLSLTINVSDAHFALFYSVPLAILHVAGEQHPRDGCSISVVRGEAVQ